MGKSQKKKSMRRHNPMRVPDSHLPHGLASAESTSSKTEAVLPIMQKMESSDPLERKWACVAVSNLIQNDPSTRRLLQGKNVVGSLITRLTDSEEEVVVEAAGSLRNLCVDGGFDICAEMYNKNILAPLKTYIPKISTILQQYLTSPKDAPENAKTLVFQLSENVITILWCLSETSNKALSAINDINLVPFLLSFLASREKLSLSPVIAAAQCLYVLTDDNYPAVTEVRSNAGYISTLISIVQHDVASNGKGKEPAGDERNPQLKVLAAGVLRNVSPLPVVSAVSTVNLDRDVILPVLEPIVTAVSLSEIAASVQELVVRLETEPKLPSQGKNGPQTDHKSNAELELERLESQLRTIQLALEILTDACATLPDPGPDAGPEEEDDDIDLVDPDESMDADGMTVDDTQAAPKTPKPSLSLPSLVPPLLNLIQPTSLSFPPLAAPSVHPPTTSALSSIHIAALECLNNIFLSLAISDSSQAAADREAGESVWNALWQALEVVGTETGLGQERRTEFWTMAVGVLWGVGGVWKGIIAPNEIHVGVLTQLCNNASDERLRVRCVGTLECLAQHQESLALNKTISEYFLSFLNGTQQNPGAEPLIQASSALIDIYSDENSTYDINFRKGGYLNQLIDGVDQLKRAIKSIDRKKEGGKELRRRGEETRENLVDFIQYRRGLRL